MIHGALRDGRRRAANAPSTKFSFICSRPTAWQSRAFATPAAQGSASAKPPPPLYPNLKRIRPYQKHKFDESQKSGTSNSKTEDYLRRLDQCLPLHLRSNTADQVHPAGKPEDFKPEASKTAEFVLQANAHFKGFLPWLAVDQGRWKAAVWIVKLLVESYHAESPRSNRAPHLVQQWNWTGPLDDLLQSPLYLKPKSGEPITPHIKTSSAASLHELTDDNKPDKLGRFEKDRHEVLGIIWRGIGRLIISCANDHDIAGGEVKPEVLEMIALLHHYELMPSSVYTFVPSESRDAIQQPPTLHLLSSRIMTALSDATWRAREMTAVEEAKRKGGRLFGLEAKGSSYRVRVSGIKPEIWLELILWSCLHGGWILEGASLLTSFARSKGTEQWQPISWRDALGAIMPFGQTDLLDWDSIKYMFDTRTTATMDDVDVTGLRVEKTVSSEVVNAYIDALLNTLSVGVGGRGISLSVVTRSLRELREFLQRANLNLGGGSWDAMLLRLVESGGINIEKNPHIVRRLVELSPRIGEELESRRSQVLPSYVLDGSAALLGILHRALHVEIKNGDLEGALQVFKLLQERVDDDRHRSLGDFFERMHLNSASSKSLPRGLFDSNFSGIDYPSFDTQIPPTTLAAFLELVTENKAFAFGRWMLTNQDVDGPIIHDHLYQEPAIAAAIIRFATAVDDKALIAKATKLGPTTNADGQATLPGEMLHAFFDTQIELRRWQPAIRILEFMRDSEEINWTITNAASVAKVMIEESLPNTSVTNDYKHARAIFQALLTGRFGASHLQHDINFSNRLDTLLTVLSTLSPSFPALLTNQRALPKHLKFTLATTPFNKILSATASSHGSAAARALIERFTTRLADEQKNTHGKRRHIVQTLPQSMPRFFRDAVLAEQIPRSTVTLADAKGTRVAVYGSLKLGPSMVQIVCRQGLRELKERRGKGEEGLDVFVWAVGTLRRYFIDETAVWDELKSGVEGGLMSEGELRAVKLAVGERT